jgi:hypothetical protein
MEKDLATRVREWYESYECVPPWSSVYAFIMREIKKEREECKWEKENMVIEMNRLCQEEHNICRHEYEAIEGTSTIPIYRCKKCNIYKY